MSRKQTVIHTLNGPVRTAPKPAKNNISLYVIGTVGGRYERKRERSSDAKIWGG
jgi:hypothetical protein